MDGSMESDDDEEEDLEREAVAGIEYDFVRGAKALNKDLMQVSSQIKY